MSIVRTTVCNVCGSKEEEKVYGEGWAGWGSLKGKQGPQGETEFDLCNLHLDMVFEFALNLKGETL